MRTAQCLPGFQSLRTGLEYLGERLEHVECPTLLALASCKEIMHFVGNWFDIGGELSHCGELEGRRQPAEFRVPLPE